MKTGNRIAMIYGVSVLGAAGVSYFLKQRRGQELFMDTLINGAIAGTALNVVGFLLIDGVKVPVVSSAPPPSSALLNGDDEVAELELGDDYGDEEVESEPVASAKTNSAKPTGDMGKTPKKAVDILAQLNTGKLYSAMKENGVKIGLVPENPSIVTQEED